MNIKKLILLALVGTLIAMFYLLDLHSFLSLEYFQTKRDAIIAFSEENYWISRLLYFLLYVVVAALSLPAAAIITLAGGAVFGFWWGLALVSFASTIGATLAFLLARTLMREWVQQRFGSYLEPINRGMEKDGVFYLFTLRLVPLFPFFLVNLVMGLTSISTRAFYAVSQLGMLFGTALYVNVGAQLGLVSTLPGIMSLGVIRAIVVLALFPWLAKMLMRWYRNRKLLAAYTKPKKFDANLIVIGAGSAGLVTAYIAALAKARVTLVEKHRMGGDCLYTGCVPSKALLRSASVSRLIHRAEEFGLQASTAQVDFPAVMRRVARVIKDIEPHDSVTRYESLGVNCMSGTATIVSPWSVEVDGKLLTTRAIVVATGARPAVPAIPGLDKLAYLTSDTVWQLTELPKRLLVLGAGPIGCELAQAFARLGSSVTLINKHERVLPREDEEVSSALARAFVNEDIQVMHHTQVKEFVVSGERQYAVLDGSTEEVNFDKVLLALGRAANTEGFGLENLGVGLTDRGTIEVNEHLQTACPTIYACGDVTGPYQFTHMAAFQAWFASINSLFGSFKKFSINYRVVPHATFVDPEIARVGLNESEASKSNIPYEVVRYDLDDLDRAIADGENAGFIKILTVPGKDAILGVTIVGYHAAELLPQFTLAMTHRLGLKKIMNTIHVYPTLSESSKFAAAQWRKQNAPVWIYPWLEKLQKFRRGG